MSSTNGMKNIKLFELILKREGNFWIEIINDSIFLTKRCGLETIRFIIFFFNFF